MAGQNIARAVHVSSPCESRETGEPDVARLRPGAACPQRLALFRRGRVLGPRWRGRESFGSKSERSSGRLGSLAQVEIARAERVGRLTRNRLVLRGVARRRRGLG